jgi:ribosome biogenesis GTPase A
MPSDHLVSYQQSCHRLFERLLLVAGRAGKNGEVLLAGKLEQLADKLQHARFMVLILGEFKRGKSSLINALLEWPLLPVRVAPCTNALTRVQYSEKPSLNGQNLTFEQLKLELEQRVSVQANAASTPVFVGWPASWLQLGVELVDAPGLGEDAARDTRTLEALKEADGVVLVLSAATPPTRLEREFLNNLPSSSFLVWNQVDLLEDSERQEAAGWGGGRFVSAKTLEGISKLKEDLSRFLAEARGLPFLKQVALQATDALKERQTFLLREQKLAKQELSLLEKELAELSQQSQTIATALAAAKQSGRVDWEAIASTLQQDLQTSLGEPGWLEAGLSPGNTQKEARKRLTARIKAHLDPWWQDQVVKPFLQQLSTLEQYASLDIQKLPPLPCSLVPEDLPEIPADPEELDRFLGAISGLAIGGVGAAVEGAGRGSRGMLKGVGWHLALSVGLLAGGVGLPIVAGAGAALGVARTVAAGVQEQERIRGKLVEALSQTMQVGAEISLLIEERIAILVQQQTDFEAREAGWRKLEQQRLMEQLKRLEASLLLIEDTLLMLELYQ